jgi:pimeloyl-ACP methyl ester carboxylesterase
MARIGIYPNKSTNDRFIFDLLKLNLPDWLMPSSRAERAARLYLEPERHVAPPALPEPPGGVVLAIPGFSPHLNARIWGAARVGAPLVLLAHDWEGQIQDMMPLIIALTESGAQVVAFDAPAHGRSSGDGAHVLAMAAAAVAVANATGRRIDLAIGHGLGASALVLATEEGLQPARMVLLAPMVDVSWPVQQIAQAFQLDGAEQAAMVNHIDRALGSPLYGLTLHPPHSTIPGLLIHSSDDRVAPVADALHLAALWPGMRRHLVDGLGHRRLLGDRPVLDLIIRWAFGAQAGIDRDVCLD